jgi:hypothetical protein
MENGKLADAPICHKRAPVRSRFAMATLAVAVALAGCQTMTGTNAKDACMAAQAGAIIAGDVTTGGAATSADKARKAANDLCSSLGVSAQ